MVFNRRLIATAWPGIRREHRAKAPSLLKCQGKDVEGVNGKISLAFQKLVTRPANFGGPRSFPEAERLDLTYSFSRVVML